MKQNMSSCIPHRHAIAPRPTELRWACGGNQCPDKHGLLPEPSGRRHKPINCAGCDQIRAAGVLYCQQIIWLSVKGNLGYEYDLSNKEVSDTGFSRCLIYWVLNLFNALYVKTALSYFCRLWRRSQPNSSNMAANNRVLEETGCAFLKFGYSVKVCWGSSTQPTEP